MVGVPVPTIEIDDHGLREKLRKARSTVDVRRAAVMIGAEAFTRRALQLASEHVDTGRFMRSQAEAGNDAGIGVFPLSPVRPSRMQERILQILTGQVRRWENFARLYQKEGRTNNRYYRKILKNIEKARAELKKYSDSNGMAIVFDAFSGGSRMTTVRVNFSAYGGAGYVRTIGDETFVRLHNKTPHASIVEYRFGIVRRSLAAVKELSVKRLQKKQYVEKMRAAGFA